jgi:hypothetical protein
VGLPRFWFQPEAVALNRFDSTGEKTMKNRILFVAALACLSVGAVAQQSTSGQSGASSKGTGKATTQEKGGKSGQDSWDGGRGVVRENPPKQNGAVSAGDVNGDGMADKTASGPSKGSGKNAASANSQSNAKPRDAATGQTSGKRQHEPVSLSK